MITFEADAKPTLANTAPIPLGMAALCATDHVFDLRVGRGGCPACGSKHWVPLSRYVYSQGAADEAGP